MFNKQYVEHFPTSTRRADGVHCLCIIPECHYSGMSMFVRGAPLFVGHHVCLAPPWRALSLHAPRHSGPHCPLFVWALFWLARSAPMLAKAWRDADRAWSGLATVSPRRLPKAKFGRARPNLAQHRHKPAAGMRAARERRVSNARSLHINPIPLVLPASHSRSLSLSPTPKPRPDPRRRPPSLIKSEC